MAGAIGVYLPLYRVIRQRRAPLFDARYLVPTRKDIDLRLIAGAGLFGVGWGLGGFCPGPALTTAAAGTSAALMVTAAMFAGMFFHRVLGTLVRTRASTVDG
jgi:uncharacterized membrane protein YedE/YeeE